MRTQGQAQRIIESGFNPHITRLIDVENGTVEPESEQERILADAASKARAGETTEEQLQAIRDSFCQ